MRAELANAGRRLLHRLPGLTEWGASAGLQELLAHAGRCDQVHAAAVLERS